MEYIKLFWENAPKGEPTIILYEVDVDNQRLALRSIDIFVDGHTRNIPDLYDGAIEITVRKVWISRTKISGLCKPCLGRRVPCLHNR